jgi:nucleotidyltransferase/DNA polymerase involved in DNA repair
MGHVSPRIACVNLYALPVEHAFFELDAKAGELSKRVCAVRSDIRGRAVLIDVSERSRKEGVLPGMTVTEGRARFTAIEIRDRDPAGELARLKIAGEHLYTFGPIVEVTAPAFLFVDVGDVDETKVAEQILRAMKRAGHEATVAIAKDPDTARTLAAHRAHELRQRATKVVPKKGRRQTKGPDLPPLPSLIVVPADQEIRILNDLPIDALIWTDSQEDPEGIKRERLRGIHASMRVLGIQDIAGLRALPAEQVGSRFGEAGSMLMQRASAELQRPLRPYTPPESICEQHELDGLVEELEPVLFVLKRLFDRVEARLDARTLSAGSVILGFEIEPDQHRAIDHDRARRASSREHAELVLTLARPSKRAATMLALAREKLANALPGSIAAMSVEARSTALDRGAQLDLFSSYAKKLEDVSELVGRLVAAFGENAVFSPEVVDTHRPESAWKARPFEIESALEAFRVEKGPPPKRPEFDHTSLVREAPPRSTYALPAVNDELQVATMPSETLESVLADLAEKKKLWPKAIQRKPEDEPLPALPPRPMELFEVPERATLQTKNGDADGGSLFWRGTRYPILGLSGCERIEAEWWTEEPVAREYVIAEVNDGRKLWIFFEPQGEVFVHGVFD